MSTSVWNVLVGVMTYLSVAAIRSDLPLLIAGFCLSATFVVASEAHRSEDRQRSNRHNA